MRDIEVDLQRLSAHGLLKGKKNFPFSSFERVFLGEVLLFVSMTWKCSIIIEYVMNEHSEVYSVIFSGGTKLICSSRSQ